jgi:hypothetical protein
MTDDRLKTLQVKSKAWRAARKAFVRACEAKASGFELVRLGKVVEKTTREYLDLLGSITGEPPRKLPPMPLGDALVPKKKPTDE